jgi:hypothetical protein
VKTGLKTAFTTRDKMMGAGNVTYITDWGDRRHINYNWGSGGGVLQQFEYKVDANQGANTHNLGSLQIDASAGMSNSGCSLRQDMWEGSVNARMGITHRSSTSSARPWLYEFHSQLEAVPRNTINRIAFFFKEGPMFSYDLPADPGRDARYNCNFGSYIRDHGSLFLPNNPETSCYWGGGHGYHNFISAQPGTWTQVIVDMHPNAYRGSNNNLPEGKVFPDNPYPYLYRGNEPERSANNYMDSITYFYLDHRKDHQFADSLPAYVHYGPIIAYTEDERANGTVGDQAISTVTGAFNPGANKLTVGYNQLRKSQSGVQYEYIPTYSVQIRYAFSDIHQLPGGFNDATIVPGAAALPTRQHNDVSQHIFETDQIDVSGQDFIYVGIKAIDPNYPEWMDPDPVDSFRQIVFNVNDDSILPPHLVI